MIAGKLLGSYHNRCTDAILTRRCKCRAALHSITHEWATASKCKAYRGVGEVSRLIAHSEKSLGESEEDLGPVRASPPHLILTMDLRLDHAPARAKAIAASQVCMSSNLACGTSVSHVHWDGLVNWL